MNKTGIILVRIIVSVFFILLIAIFILGVCNVVNKDFAVSLSLGVFIVVFIFYISFEINLAEKALESVNKKIESFKEFPKIIIDSTNVSEANGKIFLDANVVSIYKSYVNAITEVENG